MSVFANSIGGTTAATGTGDLLVAPVVGMRPWSEEYQIGDSVWYRADGINLTTGALTGEWEYGVGTYSAANTITRTNPLGSSAGEGVPVSFSAGTKRVVSTILAPDATTLEAWRAVFGIAQAVEDAALALLVATSAYARTETQSLNAGG